jgi:hypothetical protein
VRTTSSRRPRRRLALLGALAAAALASGPGTGPAAASVTSPPIAVPPPGAAAWVVRVELGDTPILEIGRTSVDVTTAVVAATALAVNGQGPPAAVAGPDAPEASTSVVDWTDDTGSLTVAGGYAEATSAGQRWSAHAGLGQSTGTGIALASKVLSWDQQTQLLGAVQTFNDTVTPLVAQVSAAVAPLLDLLDLPAPQFSPVAPAGLIDVGGGRVLGSTAEASTAPGYATARADAAAGEVKLFGGFVTVGAVSSEAMVERGTTDQSSARSWVSGVQIAGIPVSLDAGGIHVLGGGPLGALLTPVFDGLLGQLAGAGITVRASATPTGATCCSAATVGMEIVVAAPGGPLVVSIGGAEATAPDPLPRLVATTGPAPAAVVADAVPMFATSPAPVPVPAPAMSAAPATAPRPRIGMIADLGTDVVHALRLAYLVLAGAGVAGAVLFAVAGPTRPARSKRGPS